MKVTLASSSRRRRRLLGGAGLVFEVRSPDVDESPLPGESADALVRRLALLKLSAVVDDGVVVAADTMVVTAGGVVLGKPVDLREARRFLSMLNGKAHRLLTGWAVGRAGAVVDAGLSVSTITMRQLDDDEVDALLQLSPMEKAGGFTLDETTLHVVRSLQGSPSNAMGGLPLDEVLPAISEALKL